MGLHWTQVSPGRPLRTQRGCAPGRTPSPVPSARSWALHSFRLRRPTLHPSEVLGGRCKPEYALRRGHALVVRLARPCLRGHVSRQLPNQVPGVASDTATRKPGCLLILRFGVAGRFPGHMGDRGHSRKRLRKGLRVRGLVKPFRHARPTRDVQDCLLSRLTVHGPAGYAEPRIHRQPAAILDQYAAHLTQGRTSPAVCALAGY